MLTVSYPERPIPLVEPDGIGVGMLPCKNVRGSVAVDIPHRQAICPGIAEALVRSPERPVPVVPPDIGPDFPANQRIQPAILVKIAQEDRRQRPVANFLGCSRKYPLLPPLRPTMVDP